ncbi:MAG: hypothetical protein A3J42_09690 [Candidatus Dadabacteria bacterium RIFCSPHIGHO2_12_FULL_53_21]|nr:MAG: hypothetical protein A3J42_09690 [Candidatus Dadabacteria bacterium RIFCSPHIGHO2_12_FULL_53_21]
MEMEAEKTTETGMNQGRDDERRRFILQIVQPGLAGLMDGTVSSLVAPLFAAALATRDSRTAFLVGLATAPSGPA